MVSVNYYVNTLVPCQSLCNTSVSVNEHGGRAVHDNDIRPKGSKNNVMTGSYLVKDHETERLLERRVQGVVPAWGAHNQQASS